jgi:hypothetical protein
MMTMDDDDGRWGWLYMSVGKVLGMNVVMRWK